MLITGVQIGLYDDSVQLTFISKKMEVKEKKKMLPHPYLTHRAAPLVHLRCANEYFSESKWILLLSQTRWHWLQRYRWGISGGHAPSAGVMYRDFMGSGHFRFPFYLSR